jgi:hypothetical protein
MSRTTSLTDAQVTEILSLHKGSEMGGRAIADALQISYGKVRGVLERARTASAQGNTAQVDAQEEASLGASAPSLTGPAVRVAVWDIETTDFKSDIGRLTVSSFYYPEDGDLRTKTFKDFKDGERGLAVWTRDRLAELDFVIGHNHKAFDRNFLNGVLARHEAGMIPRIGWWDTYLIARYGLKGNMGVSMANPDSLDEIARRCEEDVKLNYLIFLKLKPYLHRWLHRNEG